jgi:hypothetical protein
MQSLFLIGVKLLVGGKTMGYGSDFGKGVRAVTEEGAKFVLNRNPVPFGGG